ncbi:MAG: glycosyltransferase family 4 protein [Thaumarchaeota archaeon]|nr:glycosyltransferase family 4 protein [Nitrososphaerota archaeon]
MERIDHELITKVCRFVGEYPRAGEASYGLQPVFVNLSEEQARMGYEVHVIARRSPGQPSHETVKGVEIHRVNSPFNVTALDLSLRLTGGEPGWVLHPHATSGIFLSITSRWGRTPLVCHSHGTSRSHNVPISLSHGEIKVEQSSGGMPFHVVRERMLWSSADRLLVVSKAVERDVTGTYGINPEKVRVVYNGVDASLFSPKEGVPLPAQLADLGGKRIVLFVGHFGLRKGIFYVIRAMKRVRSEIPDAHLVCIGGTPAWLGRTDFEQMLRGEMQRNGVEDCVTLLDAVKNTELIGFYRHSEVFVLPTYYEAFPKVVVEAMACGKPVVATRTGGIPELVKDGETGLLIPFGSPDAISEELIALLEDEHTRAAMGRRGRERVERLFTWHAVAERTRSAYDELMHN